MTSEKLLPISIVAIYWPGLSVKSFIILDPNAPCFLSSSIRSLLEATNAISIPEKNADRIIARRIIKIKFIHYSLLFFLCLCLIQANKKQIRDIDAKIGILPDPPFKTNLIPARMQRAPVTIQIISIIRRELLFIWKIYVSSDSQDFPPVQMGI
jgi:hypothetical protein